MSTAHASLTVTDRVIAVLKAAGLTVGDGVAPDGMTKGCVVYPLGGGTVEGPLEAHNSDAELTYQVTSVGLSRAQCEWVADKVRSTLLAADLSVAARAVVFTTVDMVGGAMRDDDVQPPVFVWPERFRLGTVPA